MAHHAPTYFFATFHDQHVRWLWWSTISTKKPCGLQTSDSFSPSPFLVFSFRFDYSSKEDGPHLAVVQDQGDPWRGRSKLLSALRMAKIHLIESSSMSYVSAIKLIRTDTTLDLSQKAEKRCLTQCLRCKQIRFRSTDDLWAKLKLTSALAWLWQAVSLSCGRAQRRTTQRRHVTFW